MTETQPVRLYRFGVYEADVVTGELRRQGIRVRLSAQSFQVLCLLLDRKGELLTREEISKALWPDGTFVDFEHGVNSAVNRLREALRDAAGNPRFIETLARRGYRFVAPVEPIVLNGNSQSQSAAPLSAQPEPVGGRRTILASPHELPKISYPVARTLFVLLQLMYVGFYVGALANLAEIEQLFSVLSRPTVATVVLIVTAAILIPVRAFVLSAVLFHAPRAKQQYLRLWPLLLPLDILWALSPFLLLHHINLGLALACTALLVYSPFAQRSLALMGACDAAREASAVVP